MRADWIKLNDWKKVCFPAVCPLTGLHTTELKTYYVYNDSILWKILWFFRIYQYIEVAVPWSVEGVKIVRKTRRKAILKGLLIGFGFALIGFVLGVYIAIEAPTEEIERLGIMLGGIGFVASLILVPYFLDYRVRHKLTPLYFKNKNKELWVRIINEDYRNKFLVLNELIIMRSQSQQDDEILDRS